MILFRQPHERAQLMRWLHSGPSGATTLAVKPETGDMVITGGCLNLSKAGLESVGGISATAVRARNLRGIAVKVTKGSTKLEVKYPVVEDDAVYSLTVQPSWLTMDSVTKKTREGFIVEFSAPAPEGGMIDWQLLR